jgi:hypothetical protein
MATFRTFCYNPSPNPSISGTEQVGDIAAAIDDVTITPGKEWWNGPDETNGYIVAYVDPSGERSNAAERILSIDTPCHLGFLRSDVKTEQSFIELVNSVFNQNFTTGDDAKTWLNANGYWTSYGEENIVFVTGIQTYSVLCRMPGDTSNWGLINLDYESNTASVRPLGLSRSEWFREDFYPLNESGYMLVFGNNVSGEHKVLFLDAAGNTVQTIDTPSFMNYDVHQGKIMSVRYSGVVWYFDGLNVYQYTYDETDLAYTEIINDAHSASSNGTIMVRIVYNDGSIVVKKLYNGTDATIIEHSSLDTYEIRLYDQADYYVIFKKTAATSVYQDFKIRKISDNTLLHSVDLTVFLKEDDSPMDYKSIDFNNYSINKFAMIIHNWDDSGVDYRIYTYNGTTDTLSSTSHVKGANYPNFSIRANSSTSLSYVGRDSVVISFSSNSFWSGMMDLYAYVDIVYQMSWHTGLNTYTYTNGGDGNEKGILLNEDGLTNNYYAICTTDNTNLQVLSITEADGLDITTLGLLTDFHGPTIHSFGNKSCFRSYAAADGTGMILKYFANTASVTDELTVTGTTGYSISTYTGWNLFGIKHEDVLYQINTTTDEIVTIGAWSGFNDDVSTSYYEASPSARQGGLVRVLFDMMSYSAIVLKPTTYVSGTLPLASNYTFDVGKNRFIYIFEDPNNGNIQINLYDFNLTLVNSILTDKTNYNFSTRAVKDRFVIRHNDGAGNYTWYMITDTFSDSIMTSTSNTTRLENDWVYWD